MLTYIAIAALALLATLALLFLTKTPAIVIPLAALIAAGMFALFARLDLGYWDPFWPIALFFSWLLAAAISFAALVVGRSFEWRLFVGNRAFGSENSQSAL